MMPRTQFGTQGAPGPDMNGAGAGGPLTPESPQFIELLARLTAMHGMGAPQLSPPAGPPGMMPPGAPQPPPAMPGMAPGMMGGMPGTGMAPQMPGIGAPGAAHPMLQALMVHPQFLKSLLGGAPLSAQRQHVVDKSAGTGPYRHPNKWGLESSEYPRAGQSPTGNR